jgi:hypothetical protein
VDSNWAGFINSFNRARVVTGPSFFQTGCRRATPAWVETNFFCRSFTRPPFRPGFQTMPWQMRSQ